MKKKLYILTLAIITASALMACGSAGESVSSSGIPGSFNSDKKCESVAKKYEAIVDAEQKEAANSFAEYFCVCEEACVENECSEATEYIPNSRMAVEPEFPIPEFNTEEYNNINENGFVDVSTSPLSTFSADVDTASYANVRRMIFSGCGVGDIPTGSVRTEEMLNYFDYKYNLPNANEPFGVNAEISTCPWNENNKLLKLGLQTEAIDFSDAADSNIVFLIDVSGSMYDENKLPLLTKSFELMIENLSEKDKVSIVTYADGDTVVLEGVPASDKETIIDALEGLKAGGGTAGSKGIVTAYELAEENFIAGGNNRVILATDGDFNIGISNQSDLSDLIKEEAENNIYLSVLGFGMGNYSDSTMETLADDGNGNYAYIDTIKEANKVLVENLGATMVTVAKDVKLQVEFNPLYVSNYRLIGYEDRKLANEDFEDDTKDAGEIGAGHSVTALYEIVPNNGTTDSKLKYQTSSLTEEALNSNDWLTLSIRYKEPDEDTSKLLEYEIGASDYTDKPSNDFQFAAAVAEFSMVLRDSEFLADGSLDHVSSVLDNMDLGDDEYRNEFKSLIDVIKYND